MQTLIKPLEGLAELLDIRKQLQKQAGILQIAGCVDSQKTHMMYALSDGFRYKIIACSGELKAKQIYEEYKFLDEHTYLYPAKDLLFYQADLRSKELLKERMEVVQALLEEEQATVVTSFDGFMDSLLPLEEVKKRSISILLGDTVDMEELIQKISGLGYEREAQIEGIGQFAVRGGIIDVYPLTEEVPVRIELWGDEVDSIRTFDLESQRSIERSEERRVGK